MTFDILLTGSIAYDYLMQFPGYFRDHILPDQLESLSLSFLVESMVRRRGGIAPNIAYTMALLGQQARIMATVGEDFEDYRKWLESQGIDTSLIQIVPNDFTASFFCSTDRSNAQIASFYPGAMAHAAELSLQDLDEPLPDLVVISPNDPAAMIQTAAECREMGIPYVYDPSQQIIRLEAADVRRDIEGARALFVNEYEFGLVRKLTGMSQADLSCQVELIVITRGQEGSEVFVGEQVFSIPVVPPAQVADPTGVGDAFRGGFLTGYAKGFDLQTCGQMGALAATYCLENQGTQSHSFTPAEFVSRFRRHYDDSGQLNGLLNE